MSKQPSKKASTKMTWTLGRIIRVLSAVIVFTLLTLSFVDPWNIMPNGIGHFLASLQFVPALHSILAGAGIVALIILLAHLVITLLFGRIYCSFICPLGILQDIISRIGKFFRKKIKGKLTKPLNALRYSILGVCVISFILGVQGYVMMWLDPYSEYGRMMNSLLRPGVAEVNNLVSDMNPDIYRIPAEWAQPLIMYVPIALFALLILIMALWRGRLYCNSICPVGSLLGLISRYSLFKMTFDKDACVRCGNCMKACKSECIDLKKGTIDGSRCVACFDCASACNEKGIHFRPTWGKKSSNTPCSEKSCKVRSDKSAPKNETPQTSTERNITEHNSLSESISAIPHSKLTSPSGSSVLDALPQMPRRAFIGTTIAGVWAGMTGCQKHTNESMRKGDPNEIPKISPGISPAGSKSVERFLDYCTACHLCLEACPTKCLRPAFMEYGIKGILKPHLTFEEALCNYDCTACADACPVGAILPISVKEKAEIRIGLARFDIRNCIVTREKTDCGACSEHCPTKALEMVPIGEELQQPVWHQDHCVLCTGCVDICPVKALKEVDEKIVLDAQTCIGCKKCAGQCEAGALSFAPAKFTVRIPKLIEKLCIGCGGCEFACPEKAIMIDGLSVHEKAEILVQEQVKNPNEGEDFPF